MNTMNTNKKCIAVVQYRPLEELPPVMTLLTVLQKIGYQLHYFGIESEAGKTFLENIGVKHTWIPYKNYRHCSKFNRAIGFLYRRLWLIRQLKKLATYSEKLIIWFQECHSAALVGNEALKIGSVITTFFEYECNYGERWIGFSIEKMLHESVIVECERNRALMTQKNHSLKQIPFVLPNKVEINFSSIPPLNDDAKNILQKIGNRPLFLYQGNIADDRQDIPYILETIAKNRPEYCVLSLPGNNAIKKAFAKYSNAFTLERIPAPGHLAVTAKASIGIAVYSCEGEGIWADNARNCAPNKIYEYAAFGVPTLGNQLPGLESTIGAMKAGVLCEMNEQSILLAADELVHNLPRYQENARSFYRACDLTRIVEEIVDAASKPSNDFFNSHRF